MNFIRGAAILMVVFATTSCSQSSDSGVDTATEGLTGSCKWTTFGSPNVGTSDNSLSAVAGERSTDVWAVGSLVPDSNPDITVTLVNHFDGRKWSVVSSPNVGTQANSFNGVSATAGKAWAVGFYIDSEFATQSLIEEWDGSKWSVVVHPQPGSSNLLSSVSAFSPSDIWAVGFQTDAQGTFKTLTEHFDGRQWSVVSSPNPGSVANQLYGVTALASNDVWAVGGRVDNAPPDRSLIVHWTGATWSVVPPPSDDLLSTNLFAVSGFPGSSDTWAVGDAHSNLSGSRTLIEEERHPTEWKVAPSPSVGSDDNHLYGIDFVTPTTGWAVGSELNPDGNMETVVLTGGPGNWSHVSSPSPGIANGDSVLGAIAVVGSDVWAVGAFDGVNALQTLIERCH